jgi:hypothetical protein
VNKQKGGSTGRPFSFDHWRAIFIAMARIPIAKPGLLSRHMQLKP